MVYLLLNELEKQLLFQIVLPQKREGGCLPLSLRTSVTFCHNFRLFWVKNVMDPVLNGFRPMDIWEHTACMDTFMHGSAPLEYKPANNIKHTHRNRGDYMMTVTVILLILINELMQHELLQNCLKYAPKSSFQLSVIK